MLPLVIIESTGQSPPCSGHRAGGTAAAARGPGREWRGRMPAVAGREVGRPFARRRSGGRGKLHRDTIENDRGSAGDAAATLPEAVMRNEHEQLVVRDLEQQYLTDDPISPRSFSDGAKRRCCSLTAWTADLGIATALV